MVTFKSISCITGMPNHTPRHLPPESGSDGQRTAFRRNRRASERSSLSGAISFAVRTAPTQPSFCQLPMASGGRCSAFWHGHGDRYKQCCGYWHRPATVLPNGSHGCLNQRRHIEMMRSAPRRGRDQIQTWQGIPKPFCRFHEQRCPTCRPEQHFVWIRQDVDPLRRVHAIAQRAVNPCGQCPYMEVVSMAPLTRKRRFYKRLPGYRPHSRRRSSDGWRLLLTTDPESIATPRQEY
jgi:hypothetical protein